MVKEKACKNCGKNFKHHNPQKIYCDAECGNMAIFEKQRMKSWKRRQRIYRRDNWTCVYCGKDFKDYTSALELDHKIPRTNGGGDEDENMATSCWICNHKKGKKLLKPGCFMNCKEVREDERKL